MSESGSEAARLVGEAYKEWNTGGASAFMQFTSPGVELHDAPELPDAQCWTGRDAVLGRLDDVVASTGGNWADIREVRSLGDEVLVSLSWRLSRDSAATLGAVYHLVTVTDGRIARIRVYLDRAAALIAAWPT